MIQIVIDIDDETYNDIKKGKIYSSFRDVPLESVNAIANGTPLPKGHGRLIDADELKKIIQENDVLNMTGFNVRLCDINNTPTIIEADTGSEVE